MVTETHPLPVDLTCCAAADAAPARTAERADGCGTAADVPFSKTGRKITDKSPTSLPVASESLRGRPGYELDAEWVEFFSQGKRLNLVRTPLPLESGVNGAALIDWLAFTVRAPEDRKQGEEHIWVILELQRLGLIGIVEVLSGGYAGYKHKAHFEDDNQRLCLIAWGGQNQAATVYVSFPGQGCARIQKWAEVRAWLEQHNATITRLDLAYDDFQAERVSGNPIIPNRGNRNFPTHHSQGENDGKGRSREVW